MYEHIFQHSVTFLQNGSSRAMTHHHSPGWWVMTHHGISRGWQVWPPGQGPPVLLSEKTSNLSQVSENLMLHRVHCPVA